MKRTSWILLILLVIAVGAYFLVSYRTDKLVAEPTEIPSTTSYLIEETDEILMTMRMYDQDYHIVELIRNSDGIWELTLPVAGPADGTLTTAAESQINALRIVTALGTVEDLSEFGLTFPVSTLKLTYTNEIEHKIEVGNASPTGSGYYIQLDDGDVFVVSSYALDAVLGLIITPPYPGTPTPPLEEATPTP